MERTPALGTRARTTRATTHPARSVIVVSEYDLHANYSCPACGRPTLAQEPDETVDYVCAVCGERVRQADLNGVTPEYE